MKIALDTARTIRVWATHPAVEDLVRGLTVAAPVLLLLAVALYA